MSEIELVDHFERMNKVVEELLKGNSTSEIAKTTGLKRGEVANLIDEWKSIAQTDNRIRERAKEALTGADQHYSMIINQAWETVAQADANSQYNIKAQALKLVADVESKRIDMLQKAGFLEDNELAERMLDNEKKQLMLVNILKEVTSKCDKCRVEVARRLSAVTNRVEEIIVIDE
jgi:ElaB/YqjD/DUF883 family membrane-anchored ribosome-binding protein